MLLKSSQATCSTLFMESNVFNIFICGTFSSFSRNTCQIINKLPFLFDDNFNIMLKPLSLHKEDT